MTNTTLRIMDRLEPRLNKLISMEVGACGFEERLQECERYRMRMERWLAGEIDNLVALLPGAAGREL